MIDNLKAPTEIPKNLEYRTKVLENGMEDTGFAAGVRGMLGEPDPELIRWWISTFCWTFNPMLSQNMRRPFIIWDFQHEKIIKKEIDHIMRGHDHLFKKSRKMGFTWTTLGVLAYLFLFSDEPFASLLISRKEGLVEDPGNPDALFWKFDYLVQDQPRWLIPWKDQYWKRKRKLHRENPVNKAVCDGEATTENMSAGGRRNVIFLDEFARVRNGLDTKALSATRDATPCRLFGSTSEGRGTEFWNLEQSDKVACTYIHWSLHPEGKRGLYREAKDGTIKVLDDYEGPVKLYRGTKKNKEGEKEQWIETYQFPDEYPFREAVADPALRRAYRLRSPWFDSQCNERSSIQEVAQQLEMDDGRAGDGFFDEMVLERISDNHVEEPTYVGNLNYTYDPSQERVKAEKFVEDYFSGSLKLWCDLFQGRPPQSTRYVAGGDISRGTGASNSTLSIFDGATKEQVAELATPHLPPDEFAEYTVAVLQWFGGILEPLLNFEVNGPGVFFKRKLQNLKYTNVFQGKRASGKREEGWHNNPSTKLPAFGDTRDALSRGELIPKSEELIAEAREYVTDKNGNIVIGRNADLNTKAREAHGDRIVGLVCAHMALESIGPVLDNEWMPNAPEQSIAWFEQREKRHRDRERQWEPNVF